MSLFRYSDYAKKHETVHKTKLPTKYKTKKHRCSQCTRTDAKQYPISEKEVRWLCPRHLQLFRNGSNIETSVSFTRASHLETSTLQEL